MLNKKSVAVAERERLTTFFFSAIAHSHTFADFKRTNQVLSSYPGVKTTMPRWSPIALKHCGTGPPSCLRPPDPFCVEQIACHWTIIGIWRYHPPHYPVQCRFVRWVHHELWWTDQLPASGMVQSFAIMLSGSIVGLLALNDLNILRIGHLVFGVQRSVWRYRVSRGVSEDATGPGTPCQARNIAHVAHDEPESKDIRWLVVSTHQYFWSNVFTVAFSLDSCACRPSSRHSKIRNLEDTLECDEYICRFKVEVDISAVMDMLQALKTKLEQDFPDAEIVQSCLQAHLSEEHVQSTFFAELGLDVQMTLLFPTVHECHNVVRVTQGFEDIHLVPFRVPTLWTRDGLSTSSRFCGKATLRVVVILAEARFKLGLLEKLVKYSLGPVGVAGTIDAAASCPCRVTGRSTRPEIDKPLGSGGKKFSRGVWGDARAVR
ncbi:kinase-like protein, partial [Aureobasidium melanogenum]